MATLLRSKPATMAGFIRFINDQPSVKPLNHSYWESCAVGEYLVSLGQHIYVEGNVAVKFAVKLKASSSWKFNHLYYALAENNQNVRLQNYGDLQDFIANGYTLI